MVVTGNQGSIPEREPEKRLPHPRKAAGTQITHSRLGEVVSKNNDTGLFRDPVIGMIARTKVRGSKAIRYRRSSDRKLCQPAIRCCLRKDTPGSFRETRASGFRGKYGCKTET
ncbi:hypothetical protein NPIL_368881 [Nephila pilipes]|uniref:Uncharacterized protein n=1 Tax=Nephila pilipes TaxID=299642 RepID=A0A8X6NTV8_NEPPI|nr:hypothetical protein NPIL_368881 [Nephila pilipes]